MNKTIKPIMILQLTATEFCNTVPSRAAADLAEAVALPECTTPDDPRKVPVIPTVLPLAAMLDVVAGVVTRPVTFVDEIDPPASVNAVLATDSTLDTGGAIDD
jgi:hypothetical protein